MFLTKFFRAEETEEKVEESKGHDGKNRTGTPLVSFLSWKKY